MAIEKAKREKESKIVLSEKVNAGTLKEAGKKSTLKKAAEVKEAVEVKKPKKAVAEKEEKPAIESKKTITAEKAPKKAKATPTISEEKTIVAETPAKESSKKPAVKKAVSKQVIAESVPVVEEVSAPVETIVPAAKASIKAPKAQVQSKVKVTFQLRYSTSYGQSLFISGNSDVLGNGDVTNAFPLQYFNHEYWYAEVEFAATEPVFYNYYVINEDGSIALEPTNNKSLAVAELSEEVLVIDTWNNGSSSNNLYPEPFQPLFLLMIFLQRSEVPA